MNYAKPALTLDEQVEQLLRRGMVGDPAVIRDRLSTVNYFRLSAYWFTFKVQGDPAENFKPGTSFEHVWDRYVFDRRLRLLVLDAIERIEVAARTQIAFEANKDSQFVKHFRAKYTNSTDLPIWMATELMPFGSVLRMYQGCDDVIRDQVARRFDLTITVLESWLLTLNNFRNIAAHHGRLWNRNLVKPPKLPARPQDHGWASLNNLKPFTALTICNYLLERISPGASWAQRVRRLVDEYPAIPKDDSTLGVPSNWTANPLWANAR